MTPVLASIPVGLTWALFCSAFLLLRFVLGSSRIHWAGAAFWICPFRGTRDDVLAFRLHDVGDFFWNWVVLFFVTVVAASMKWSTKRTLVCGLTLTAAVYVIAAVTFLPEYRERVTLRAEYPLESLVERLAYENRRREIRKRIGRRYRFAGGLCRILLRGNGSQICIRRGALG